MGDYIPRIWGMKELSFSDIDEDASRFLHARLEKEWALREQRRIEMAIELIVQCGGEPVIKVFPNGYREVVPASEKYPSIHHRR